MLESDEFTKRENTMTLSTKSAAMITLLGLMWLLTPASHAQQDFSNVEIVAHHVAGSVYYLQGAGGNIGLSIGEDGVVMIDDQYAPLTDKILAAIRQLNEGEIRFVINTHVHGDHTGGNENLGKLGILILARDEVRVRLAAQSPAAALPVLTYSDAITIHLNGEEVYAFPVPPAHTDGDTFIHFVDSDVIHTGDVFRTTAFPVIDTNNGGTLDGSIQALGLLIGTAGPDTLILPGHGDVSSRMDVMGFRDMILDVRDQVAPMVESGMSYEEVAAADPTAAYNDRYGNPDRFLRAVYTELGGALD
ncbi:MAG TPA: MBL fold metallo-hydrolase [Gammaproteobacteria bacterium]|nr:MBL fold metallo-hydrolase [Gammaproteobacteria bacterium]HAR89943.1 MBL fold metallo-hydrolase [Gammaproteobacteria bacterium]HAU24620.1 MBL fold metallo-hydrolase [Gammaproteobacteria bacterium]HCA38018.1 MBL fold metallo-hydrolase [Gammaproteobacteria bacterium]|tara:strand:- start:219 stop:1130 length:912 start_codon:yes stop_codon:yes gene_type:complete